MAKNAKLDEDTFANEMLGDPEKLAQMLKLLNEDKRIEICKNYTKD